MNCCWCTITTDQLEESVAFYEEVIGLSVARRFSPSPDTEIAFLKDDRGFEVELLKNGRPTSDDLNGISLGFEVKSLADTLALVKSKNIPVFGGPTKVPGLHLLFCQRPEWSLHPVDRERSLKVNFIAYRKRTP